VTVRARRYVGAVFDQEFFSGPSWDEKIREFSADNEDSPLRVVICTTNGSRYDVVSFTLSELGMNLLPRVEEISGEMMMVLLPFDQIAQIEVSSIRDRREAGFSAE
jgi:hypothetical protein